MGLTIVDLGALLNCIAGFAGSGRVDQGAAGSAQSNLPSVKGTVV